MKATRAAVGAALFLCMAMASPVWAGDNGNGTITVNGLVWLKDASCIGRMNWDTATKAVATLSHGMCGLTDNSRPGMWRMPSREELHSIYPYIGYFTAVQPNNYWSSTPLTYPVPGVIPGTTAWFVKMSTGTQAQYLKTSNYFVWAVRPAQ